MRIGWILIVALSARAQSPEQKAINYLIREVPRWSVEKRCFSCHNNGDGARALFAAVRRGVKVPDKALEDTTKWLSQPEKWNNNRGNPHANDRKLARIQFAASLTEACAAGFVEDCTVQTAAAESLLSDQEKDGSWQVDAAAADGSPVTYGSALATYMARRSLERADPIKFADQISKANDWLIDLEPANILDAAAKLLAVRPAKTQCLELILPAQNGDGGWGPRLHAPSEPFDTAIVLLAIREVNGPFTAITRARTYLVSTQQPSGGWPPTTRPPGGQSYAQHISSSAWAALALMATQ